MVHTRNLAVVGMKRGGGIIGGAGRGSLHHVLELREDAAPPSPEKKT